MQRMESDSSLHQCTADHTAQVRGQSVNLHSLTLTVLVVTIDALRYFETGQ